MNKTILIAEDNPEVLKIVKSYLEFHKYSVITAVDGWDCLHQVTQKTPDLVVLDVGMPHLDGLNSLEMIRLLDSPKKKRLPVILLTALADKPTILRAGELGIQDYLVKPCSLNDLTERIANQLLTFDGLDLKELFKGLFQRDETLLNSGKIKDVNPSEWDCFTTSYFGTRLIIFMKKGLTPERLKECSEEIIREEIMVYIKQKANDYRCLLSPAKKKMPLAS